jgi:hypothetical protein
MVTRKLIYILFLNILLYSIDSKANGSAIFYSDEKAFVHTDREFYIAGENVFFKLYIINSDSHKLSDISKIAYFILRNSASVPIAKIRFKVEGGIAYGSFFLSDTLSSGLYQIIAFTNWMRNWGEESFFRKEIFVANRFDKELHVLDAAPDPSAMQYNNAPPDVKENIYMIVTPDKAEYNKREKINLSLKFPENTSDVAADISISVFERVPGTGNRLSICNYLSKKSDNSISKRLPDLQKLRFLPETKGEIIQGRIIDRKTREAVANSCIFLSAKDSIVNLKYDYSDTNGLFRFLLNDYYDEKDLYFSIKDNPEDNKLKIEPDDKFELNDNFKPLKHQENSYLKDFILKCQDIVSIQKVYNAASSMEIKKQFKTINICPRIYYKPSYSVKPSDFLPLNDFVDISAEILPPQLRIRKHNNIYTANMADENQHMFMEEKPVIFLDGVLIDDVSGIIHLGSDKVKRIEMVCTRYNYGEQLFPGILAVFSNKGEINHLEPLPGSLRLQLEPYQPYSVFINRTYLKENLDYMPDFRQLLFWNPDVKISKNNNQDLEFYASDHSGSYIIEVEGISNEGIPISAIAKIIVK